MPHHASSTVTGPRLDRRILAVVLVLLAACSSGGGDDASGSTSSTTRAPSSTTAPAEVGPVTVVVLGSSTAAGYGLADPGDAWVARYAAALDAEDEDNEVVNLAVSGTTTFHALPTGTPTEDGRPAVDPEHNVSAALALAPGALIVNYPSNDTVIGVPADRQIENLEAIAAAAEAAGVEVWVTTTQPRNLDDAGRRLLDEVRALVLARFGDRALDFWTGVAADDGTILPGLDSGDGIHLTADAHADLAGRVEAADLPRQVAAA